MSIKVGLNGFGRIGRAAVRIIVERDDMELAGINLRKADLDYMVYAVKYDTVFRNFNGTVTHDEDHLIINGKKIRVFSEPEVSQIPWSECGAEYIIESTGAFLTTELAGQHLQGGAKKVVISAPAKDSITPTFVMGVNNETYTSDMTVVSNASCTTNCLAPLSKVINDNFGIEEALMSTIHAATSKQKSVDARAGSDWRASRSVFGNIIPSSTGAAKAVGLVIPELKGRMTGMSFRIPTNDASVVDLTARLAKPATYEEICEAIHAAAEGPMKGILTYTNDPIVSSDILGNPHTSIVDEGAGIMLNDHFVKLISWYDNEWGYSNKCVDLIAYMASVDHKE